MFALRQEAQRRNAFARALAHAFAWLRRCNEPDRRWHDERERLNYIADMAARRALANAGLAPERRRSF